MDKTALNSSTGGKLKFAKLVEQKLQDDSRHKFALNETYPSYLCVFHSANYDLAQCIFFVGDNSTITMSLYNFTIKENESASIYFNEENAVSIQLRTLSDYQKQYGSYVVIYGFDSIRS